jgi:hypothetical protein
MLDEVATNPAPEAPAEGGEVAHEAAVDENEQHLSEGEETGQEPVDDSEEIEHDGQKYRVPKALKDSFLRQSDYTRKTQEVAEQRKALEQQQKQLAQQAESQQAHIKDVAKLVAMDDQLSEWSKVDWQAWNTQDPQAAQAAFFRYDALKNQRAALEAELKQKQEQRNSEAQREYAKRAEEALATLKREIPEWSPELDRKLTDFGVAKGLTREQLTALALNNPKAVKILHLAMVGEQLIEKNRAAARPQTPDPKPVPVVAARSAPVRRDPDKMPVDEWLKWRNEQIAKRR